MQTRWFCVATF